MKKFQKAFSLIELSIVILIIGILIAGVIESSNLLNKSRLSSARNLTQNSPVHSIKNLVAWYETTSKESFDSTIDANDASNNQVSTWYDINPQSQSKKNAYQTVLANQPTYEENVLNGLPALLFDSDNQQYLDLPDGTIPSGDSSYSIFCVIKNNDTANNRSILGSGNYSDNNGSNAFRFDNTGALRNYWWYNDVISDVAVIEENRFYIIGFTYNSSLRKIYLNGSVIKSEAASNRSSTPEANTIGKTHNLVSTLEGYIAEIIMYDRGLRKKEIEDINDYLSHKWGITVNHT